MNWQPLNMEKRYRKLPKLLDAKKKDANGRANSEDPDQTAPLGAV